MFFFTGTEPPNKVNSSRRRPAVTVKALTSSEISAKYNALLDERLAIISLQKQGFEEETKQRKMKFEKEMILLDLKIKIEQEKLRNEMRNKE